MPYPSKRDPELEADILDRLARGEPLAQICRLEGKPSANAWRDWCAADEALAIAYARAREDGFDFLAADTLTIIDAVPERIATQFGDKVDPGFVQHQKNRAEQRLKLLAKWDPKRYGERIDHTSSDGTMSPARTLADFYGERK